MSIQDETYLVIDYISHKYNNIKYLNAPHYSTSLDYLNKTIKQILIDCDIKEKENTSEEKPQDINFHLNPIISKNNYFLSI